MLACFSENFTRARQLLHVYMQISIQDKKLARELQDLCLLFKIDGELEEIQKAIDRLKDKDSNFANILSPFGCELLRFAVGETDNMKLCKALAALRKSFGSGKRMVPDDGAGADVWMQALDEFVLMRQELTELRQELTELVKDASEVLVQNNNETILFLDKAIEKFHFSCRKSILEALAASAELAMPECANITPDHYEKVHAWLVADETTKMLQRVERLVLVSGESAAQAHAEKYQFVLRFLGKLTRLCQALARGQNVSAPELEGFAEGLWQMQAGQCYANQTLGPLTTSRKWRRLIDSLKSVVLAPILSQLRCALGHCGVLKLHFGMFPKHMLLPPSQTPGFAKEVFPDDLKVCLLPATAAVRPLVRRKQC